MTPPVNHWTTGDVEHTSQRFTLADIWSDFVDLFRTHAAPTATQHRRQALIETVTTTNTTTTRREIAFEEGWT